MFSGFLSGSLWLQDPVQPTTEGLDSQGEQDTVATSLRDVELLLAFELPAYREIRMPLRQS